jgi:hypothetical protein
LLPGETVYGQDPAGASPAGLGDNNAP